MFSKNVETDKFVFIADGPLSIDYLAPFTDGEGKKYNTVREYILHQKAAMRYSEEQWAENVDEHLDRANHMKFAQNPDLLDNLFYTDNKTLVFVSDKTPLLSNGLKPMHADNLWPFKWQGQNKAGMSLMRTRSYFNGLDYPINPSQKIINWRYAGVILQTDDGYTNVGSIAPLQLLHDALDSRLHDLISKANRYAHDHGDVTLIHDGQKTTHVVYSEMFKNNREVIQTVMDLMAGRTDKKEPGRRIPNLYRLTLKA